MKSKRRSTYIKIVVILLIIALYVFRYPIQAGINGLLASTSVKDAARIKDYILSYGIWAPVVSFLMMVLQSIILPLPSSIIVVVNIVLFGLIKGSIFSLLSLMCGAIICYWITRFGSGAVIAKLVKYFGLEEACTSIRREGKYAILIARLLPFPLGSVDVVSYAAGLIGVRFREFIWVTAVGLLPSIILYAYISHLLAGSIEALG